MVHTWHVTTVICETKLCSSRGFRGTGGQVDVAVGEGGEAGEGTASGPTAIPAPAHFGQHVLRPQD